MSRRTRAVALSVVALLSLGTTYAAEATPTMGADVGVVPASRGDHIVTGVSYDAPNDGWAVGRRGGCCTGEPRARHWDGSRWHNMSLPPASEDDRLQAVDARTPNDVWAVGYSVTAGGESQSTLVEHWDGRRWQVVPSPNPVPTASMLFGVTAISADDVWAVGSIYNAFGASVILHWDGSEWSVVAHPDPSDRTWLYDVTSISARDVWAVGSYLDDQGSEAALEHWNGRRWSVVPGGDGSNQGLSGVWANGASDVWAVGYRNNGPALTEHWDGSSWSTVAAPLAGFLESVSGSATDDVWAVGKVVGGAAVIAHWDGQQWRSVASHVPPGGDQRLSGVSAVSGDQATAVGYITSSTLESITLGGTAGGGECATLPALDPAGSAVDRLPGRVTDRLELMRPGLLVIQHEDECPPGWLGEWLAEAGVRLEVVPGHRGASIPEDTSGYDGLLVLGGEMGAYDDVPCPWLAPTRRLIARAVGEGVPFLGVCLGHQLATVALGGRVARNPVGTATGLTPVVLTDAGRADPLLGTVRSGARAVQWNRDVATTLPAGSTLLARAPDASVQAVRFAALAWGVQFHPEVSPEIFASWTVNGPKALVTRPDGVNVFVAAEDIAAARDELRADWRPLAARFAGIVRSSRAPGSAPPASTSAVSR